MKKLFVILFLFIGVSSHSQTPDGLVNRNDDFLDKDNFLEIKENNKTDRVFYTVYTDSTKTEERWINSRYTPTLESRITEFTPDTVKACYYSLKDLAIFENWDYWFEP